MPDLSTDFNSEIPQRLRQRGRPKELFTRDCSVQVRLNSIQWEHLTTIAEAAGRSRSDILRAALDGVRLVEPAATTNQVAHYRQLVALVDQLRQLRDSAASGQPVVTQAEAALAQVVQLLEAFRQLQP